MNSVECVYASRILMYCNLHSKHTDLTKTQTKPTYKNQLQIPSTGLSMTTVVKYNFPKHQSMKQTFLRY